METKTCLKSFCSLLCRLEWGFKILQIFFVVWGRHSADLHRMWFVVRGAIRGCIITLKRSLRDIWNLTRYGRFNSLFAASWQASQLPIAFYIRQFDVASAISKTTNLRGWDTLLQLAKPFTKESSVVTCLSLRRHNKYPCKIVSSGLLVQPIYARFYS